MSITSGDRAEVLRDAALDLLLKADELDGNVPCECGHARSMHQTGIGAWTGFCGFFGDPSGSENQCKCERFDAW